MAKRRSQTSPSHPASFSRTEAAAVSSLPTSPASSAGKRTLFRWAAVLVIPVLLVVGLEVGLRVVGYGYPTGFLLSQVDRDGPVWVPNLRFGWRFFPPSQARQPWPFRVPQVKAPGVCRIFVFGESAAYGDPQPEFGLARQLEALLGGRFPQTQFQVINAAMTGINSHCILPLARDCAAAAGDVWVIYMGNNEVVGPYGAGTVFSTQTPPLSLVRASLAAKTTRLGQLADGVRHRLRPPPVERSEWGGMQMFVEQRVRSDDPRMPLVYAHFTRNLRDLLETGLRRGVGVVLSTVAVNLRDCPPFASMHRSSLSAQDLADWENAFRAGVLAEEGERWQEAVDAYANAARRDPGYAELQFRWARCCLRLGQEVDAQRHFALARDEDALRFRCDRRLNDLVRSAATERAQPRLRLADAEAEFARQSPQGITGANHFLEHVHLTFEGNYLLASTIAREVEPLLPESVRRQADASVPWPSVEACARRLAHEDWNRFQVATELLSRLQDSPFKEQLDHAAELQRWNRELQRLLPEVGDRALGEAEKRCVAATAAGPRDWVLFSLMAQLRLRRADSPGALAAARQVVELLPNDPGGWRQLGLIELLRQQPEDAMASFQAASRADPEDFWALEKLGQALAASGRHEEALSAFGRAIRLRPRFGPAYLGMGKSLEALGRTADAEANYRLALQHRLHRKADLIELANFCRGKGWFAEALTNYSDALRMNPADAGVHLSVGQVLTALQRPAEAQRHFAEAARLDPQQPIARYLTGLRLGRQGDAAGAAENFREAVRLMPDLLEARLNLGVALSKQGKLSEARVEFEEVLRRQPTNAVARRELRTIEAQSASR